MTIIHGYYSTWLLINPGGTPPAPVLLRLLRALGCVLGWWPMRETRCGKAALPQKDGQFRNGTSRESRPNMQSSFCAAVA